MPRASTTSTSARYARCTAYEARLPAPNPPPPPPPHPPTQQQVIGRGGFGLVYRARHRASNRTVALKVLDKRALHAEGMGPRVVGEVRLHARARGHPHVVGLLGFFEDDRSVYLVLEHCPRGDLYRHLKRHGPLAPAAAAGVMRQVCTFWVRGWGVCMNGWLNDC